MVKNVIFDLGGVIVDFNPEKVIRERFEKKDADFILGNIFFSREWAEIDRGTLTPSQAFSKYREALGHETYAKILDIVENWGDYMPPFEDTYNLIKRIKESGAKVYLLSNVPPYIRKLMNTVPALALMDGIVASADIKMLKPEKEIYEYTLRKFGLKAEECVFIDDTKINADAASQCGITGFWFKDHDIEALETALRNNGVNI